MYPNMLLLHQNIAAGLIRYRLNRVPGAEFFAKRTNLTGARFPWESAFTGRNVCPKGVDTCLQEIHVNGDIACVSVCVCVCVLCAFCVCRCVSCVCGCCLRGFGVVCESQVVCVFLACTCCFVECCTIVGWVQQLCVAAVLVAYGQHHLAAICRQAHCVGVSGLGLPVVQLDLSVKETLCVVWDATHRLSH